MLSIKDLHVSVGGKEILKGINLDINTDEVNALMGPNGSGKSTLAYVLMGHPNYGITKGQIIFNNQDVTNLSPDKRAKLGLFLSFQHPLEIPGVSVSNFLRTALNSVSENKVSVLDFYKVLREKMDILKIDNKFADRYLNEGFSGGEKKRTEILQLAILKPKIAVLDETDSGTDIDALKTIAYGINKIKQENNMGCLLITHYNRILNYVKPDKVHVMIDGKIVKSGGPELALELEQKGYQNLNE